MRRKQRKFADDGWAIWVDGDDVSTVYINNWLNPKGKSYVDLSIRIRNMKGSTCLHVYVPFAVSQKEIEDMSLFFRDTKILYATFGSGCIVDYMKNEHTSEIAYKGKTVDIVHLSTIEYEVTPLANGTLINIDLEQLQQFLDNDEAYFVWRMPHKSIDEILNPHANMENFVERFRDLITTPVVAEKYGYSIRINEARLLPEEITRIGAFHRQKLKKAVITISIDESYEINDGGCYRIRRLEEDIYRDYLPDDYKCEDIIAYQWQQTRDNDWQGHFNFYYSIIRNSINSGSMSLYMVLLLTIAIIGELLADLVRAWIDTL